MNSYRPNAAAILRRSNGNILICERLNNPGAWQFPQGGIDPGETAEQAIKREIMEEIGISEQNYTIIQNKTGYQYDYPPKVLETKKLRHKNYKGQSQTYFLLNMKDDTINPHIEQPNQEFRNFQWIEPSKFDINWVPDFKKDVFKKVFHDFFEITL